MTEEKKDRGLTETTIGALGVSLLVGSNGRGTVDKNLVFHEMTTGDERVIANKSKEDMQMTEQVSIVLAQMVDKLGEWDLSEMKFPERLIRIRQLYMADVLTACMHLRIDTIGPDFSLEWKCACNRNKSWISKCDLKSTKVTVPKDEASMMWRYQLEKPFQTREKTVTSLTISSPKWGALSKIVLGASRQEAQLETLRSCIVGINDQVDPGFDFLPQEFDKMRKRDLSAIMSQMDDHVIGPHMRVEVTCPACEKEKKIAIDWRYSNFFSVSSQSAT